MSKWKYRIVKIILLCLVIFGGALFGTVQNCMAKNISFDVTLTEDTATEKGKSTVYEVTIKNGKISVKPEDSRGAAELATRLESTANGKALIIRTAASKKENDGKGSFTFSQNINYKEDWGVSDYEEAIEKALKKIKTKTNGNIKVTATAEETTDDEDGDSKKKCADGGGAMSLGWIICPIISVAGNAAESLYNKFVEPALQIEPQLFTNSNKNVLEGWKTFQNIANIIFAILFLVVIFSQLTGVGIDNYGIKKALPKLIVVAILINLSYFICIILIDISNILGNSLQALFNGMMDGLEPTISDPEANFGEGTGQAQKVVVGLGALGGLGIAGFLVNMSGVIWNLPAVVLTLVISIIGVAVSILMLFVLLAAREAAVVILVMISPLAVVCYALPNTKNLFKKWVNVFKALLILYPIAGLLVGGGNYVSALLMNTGDGIFNAVVAMIAGIVPIFFIPTLTKNAFAGLGNIGAKISSFGDRMGKGVQNKVQNSRAYQGAKDKADAFKTSKQARGLDKLYDQDGKPLKATGRFAGVKNGMRSVRRATMGGRSGALKTMEQNYGNRKIMSESAFGAAMAGIEDKAKNEQVANVEAMLGNGRMKDKAGNVINSVNPESVGRFHGEALARAAVAKNATEREEALAQVKAAQNILSKTEGGREQVRSNFEDATINAARSGISDADRKAESEVLQTAASHAMGNFGDTYKTKDRGSHAMLQDIANGKNASAVRDAIGESAYEKAGAMKYTAETLSGADEGALKRMLNSVNADVMGTDEKAAIVQTAQLALDKNKNGSLNIKPETVEYLKNIVEAGGAVQIHGGSNSGGGTIQFGDDGGETGE